MKTLFELWKENGEKPGFMVELKVGRCNPYLVHAITKTGNFLCENNSGDGNAWSCHEPATLHIPPKPKVTVYEWMTQLGSNIQIRYNAITEEEAKQLWPNHKLTKLREFKVDAE